MWQKSWKKKLETGSTGHSSSPPWLPSDDIFIFIFFVNLYIQVVAMVDICQGSSSAQLNFLFEIIIY